MTTLNRSSSDNYPYSAVVFLEVTYASGHVYVGSGVMVGPNDVLTAAHMVYSDAEGAATRVMVSAGYDNGFAPFGRIEAAEWNYYDWDFDGDGLLSASRIRIRYCRGWVVDEPRQFDWLVWDVYKLLVRLLQSDRVPRCL